MVHKTFINSLLTHQNHADQSYSVTVTRLTDDGHIPHFWLECVCVCVGGGGGVSGVMEASGLVMVLYD